MQIAAAYAQGHLALIAEFAFVAAALLTVASLQGADRRCNPRMTLSCLTKFHARFLLLLAASVLALHRDTRMVHKGGQLLLVFRRVNSAIERGPFDPATHSLLQRSSTGTDWP
jgi:hypothetical protein